MNYFHHKVKIMLEHWRALENPHCAKISIAIGLFLSFILIVRFIDNQLTKKKKEKKKRNFVVSAGVHTVFLFFSNTSHDSSHEKKRKRLLKPRWQRHHSVNGHLLALMFSQNSSRHKYKRYIKKRPTELFRFFFLSFLSKNRNCF